MLISGRAIAGARAARRSACASALGVALGACCSRRPALAAVPTVSDGHGRQRDLQLGRPVRHASTRAAARRSSTSSTARPPATARSRRPTQLPAGSASVAVSIAVTGLAAGDRPTTTGSSRRNASGTALGADKTREDGEDPALAGDHRGSQPGRRSAAPVTIEGTLSGTGSASAAGAAAGEPVPVHRPASWTSATPSSTLANGAFAFNVLGASLEHPVPRRQPASVASADVVVSVGVDVTLRRAADGHPPPPRDPLQRHDRPGRAVGADRVRAPRRARSWRSCSAARSPSPNAVNGVVGFAGTVRVHSGGFFRALVLPVEGGHVSGYSGVAQVRIALTSRAARRARRQPRSARAPRGRSRCAGSARFPRRAA